MTNSRPRELLVTFSAAWFLASAVHADVPSPAPHSVPSPQEAAFRATSQDDIAKNFEPTPGGLTAKEVVEKALTTSPELLKATLDVNRADVNRARAKLAFAPRFDVMGKYTYQSRVKLPEFEFPGYLKVDANGIPTKITTVDGERRATLEPVSVPFLTQVPNQWYTQAAVILPITDYFLTVYPTYKGASLLADVADNQRKAKALQVAYDARVTYYNYVHLIGALVVAQASTQLLEANVRDLEALTQAGTATETDLIRARSAKAQAEHFVTQISGGQDVALTRLSQLVGSKVDGGRGVGERLITDNLPDAPDAAALTERALAVRPEVLALRALSRARGHLADGKRGGQFPKLAAFANGYYANPNMRIQPVKDHWDATWDVGVQLTWSPNDFTFARTQVADAHSDLMAVEYDLQAIQNGIGMEVASAVAAYRTAVSEVHASTEALTASRRYFDDQRALMLAGAATPNDVLLAQTGLTRDALEWVDSYVNTRIAEAALLKAQGKTGLGDTSAQQTTTTNQQTSGSTP